MQGLNNASGLEFIILNVLNKRPQRSIVCFAQQLFSSERIIRIFH